MVDMVICWFIGCSETTMMFLVYFRVFLSGWYGVFSGFQGVLHGRYGVLVVLRVFSVVTMAIW